MSSTLTVQLVDICVHIGPESIIGLPVAHRVVYPAGTTKFDSTVNVHSPSLSVGPIRVDLSGTTVSFSPASGGFGGFPLPPCVPHLMEFFPWVQTLSPDAVLFQQIGNGGKLGAYVDFDFGELSLMTPPSDSVKTQVVMTYPESTATITITPWNAPGPYQITVPLPATVTISSSALNHQRTDFLITFQVTADVPDPQQDPITELGTMFTVLENSNPPCVVQLDIPEDNVGCSNSQFP